MMYVLETERTRLRRWEEGDAAFLLTLNSDPEVMKYTGDPPFTDLEDARQFIKNYSHYREYGFGRYLVERKDSRELIGWCGVKYDPVDDLYDLGFRLMRKHWNQGYATEAARACMQDAFENQGLEGLYGRSRPENLASLRVLEKLGMTFLYLKEYDGVDWSINQILNPSLNLNHFTASHFPNGQK